MKVYVGQLPEPCVDRMKMMGIGRVGSSATR